MYCRTYWIDFEIFVCIPLPRFFHHKRKQKLTQKFRRGSWLVPARLALALTQWDLFFCRSWCHWNWCHVPRNRRRIQHIWRGIKNKNLIFRSKYPKELKMSHTNNISNFVTITWYIFNLFQKSKHYVPFLEKLFTDLVVSCKYATFSFTISYFSIESEYLAKRGSSEYHCGIIKFSEGQFLWFTNFLKVC